MGTIQPLKPAVPSIQPAQVTDAMLPPAPGAKHLLAQPASMVEVLGAAFGWEVQQLQLQRFQSPQSNHKKLDAEYPESIEDSVSKSALYLLFIWQCGERSTVRERETDKDIWYIHNFQFESCLARAVFRGCLTGCVGEGLVNAFGNQKNGKMLDKSHFPPEYGAEAETSKSLPQKYCNPFWTSWNCIVLVKAGPRCLAGEFGHGLSSLPEPQGQNQGALGWKSGRRLGIPRSSGIGIKRRCGRILKMGEIFFVFFQKVRSCTLYIIKAHHDDLAPIPPVLLQLWTTICNDYCNRIRLFSCLYYRGNDLWNEIQMIESLHARKHFLNSIVILITKNQDLNAIFAARWPMDISWT